jgi:hypothetical protein
MRRTRDMTTSDYRKFEFLQLRHSFEFKFQMRIKIHEGISNQSLLISEPLNFRGSLVLITSDPGRYEVYFSFYVSVGTISRHRKTD